jgi:hypothetical protein
MDHESEDYDDPDLARSQRDRRASVATAPQNDRWPRIVGAVILIGLLPMTAIFLLQYLIHWWAGD